MITSGEDSARWPRAVCFALGKAVLREGFFCGDATPQKNASTRGAAKSRHTARLRRGSRALAASRGPGLGGEHRRAARGSAAVLYGSLAAPQGLRAVCFAPGKAVLREGFFCGDATPQKNASTRGAAKPRHTARAAAFLRLLYHKARGDTNRILRKKKECERNFGKRARSFTAGSGAALPLLCCHSLFLISSQLLLTVNAQREEKRTRQAQNYQKRRQGRQNG